MKRFSTILSLTLLAGALPALADDATFTFADVRGEQGSTVYIEVNMENDFDARDFQSAVVLPEGLEPVMNRRGKPAVEWAGREDDHNLGTNWVEQIRQVRITGFSLSGAFIFDYTGILYRVPVTLSGPPGVYEVTITDTEVSNNDAGGPRVRDYTGTVTIIGYPESLELDAVALDMMVEESAVLGATFTPAGATETGLTWTSSDESVATVENGRVTAVGAGSAVITATTVNGLSATAAVKVGLLGDADGNLSVDEHDIAAVINHILGRPDDPAFAPRSADANKNTEVTVGDVVEIVHLMLGPTAMEMPARGADYPEAGDSFMSGGTFTNTLPVRITNPDQYTALQFDIRKPAWMIVDGVTLCGANAATHSVDFEKIDDETLRVVIFSENNARFDGDPIAQIEFDYQTSQDGTGDVRFTNALIVNSARQEYRLPDASMNLTVLTSVGTVAEDPGAAHAVFYDLQGRRINRPAHGLYIMRHKGKNGKIVAD